MSHTSFVHENEIRTQIHCAKRKPSNSVQKLSFENLIWTSEITFALEKQKRAKKNDELNEQKNHIVYLQIN